MGELETRKAEIEAILFTTGESVEAARIAQALGCSESEIHEIISGMMEEYEAAGRGIRIRKLDRNYQLCTKKEHYDVLIRIAKIPKKISLTEVQLETLAIIAYKQPVTKLEIDNIRGVKSDHAVNRLIEYDLVTELGRKDAPGRPILLGTTEAFLRHFGVDSISELPQISPLQKEDFRLEAEKEAEKKVSEKNG